MLHNSGRTGHKCLNGSMASAVKLSLASCRNISYQKPTRCTSRLCILMHTDARIHCYRSHCLIIAMEFYLQPSFSRGSDYNDVFIQYVKVIPIQSLFTVHLVLHQSPCSRHDLLLFHSISQSRRGHIKIVRSQREGTSIP